MIFHLYLGFFIDHIFPIQISKKYRAAMHYRFSGSRRHSRQIFTASMIFIFIVIFIDLLNAVELSGGNVGGDPGRHSYFLSSIYQQLSIYHPASCFFSALELPCLLLSCLYFLFVCFWFWFMFKLSGGSRQLKHCRLSACRLQPFFFSFFQIPVFLLFSSFV